MINKKVYKHYKCLILIYGNFGFYSEQFLLLTMNTEIKTNAPIKQFYDCNIGLCMIFKVLLANQIVHYKKMLKFVLFPHSIIYRFGYILFNLLSTMLLCFWISDQTPIDFARNNEMKQILGVRPVKEFTLHPHRCEGTLFKVWRVYLTPFL